MTPGARSITQWQRNEVLKLFKAARTVSRLPMCDIKAAPRSAEYARLLVVTSKSVGSAPERNTVRRRLKAIFYEDRLFEGPYDWIIFIKPPATSLSYDALRIIVHKAFVRMLQGSFLVRSSRSARS